MKRHFHLSHLAVSATMALGLVAANAMAAPPTQEDPIPQSQTPMSQPTDITISQQAKFEALDVNHDGSIDKVEANANKVLAAQFDKLDANHDAKLSPSEFAGARGLFASAYGNSGDR